MSECLSDTTVQAIADGARPTMADGIALASEVQRLRKLERYLRALAADGAPLATVIDHAQTDGLLRL